MSFAKILLIDMSLHLYVMFLSSSLSLLGGGHDGGGGPPQRPGGGGAQRGGGQARARDHLRRHQQVDSGISTFLEYIFCSQLLSLPDMKVSGIALTGGKLTGLSNLSRWGNADIDIKCEILLGV